MAACDQTKTVDDLVELWTELASIRLELQRRIAMLGTCILESADGRAALCDDGHGDVARLALTHLENELESARAALGAFEKELARHLGRVSPPWELPARFANISVPGTAPERQQALLAAIKAVIPLTGERLKHLRSQKKAKTKGSSAGTGKPPVMANKVTPSIAQARLANVALALLLAADAVHSRFNRAPYRTGSWATSMKVMETTIEGDQVTEILRGEARGIRGSARAAAEEVVGQFIGISGSAVRKATRSG